MTHLRSAGESGPTQRSASTMDSRVSCSMRGASAVQSIGGSPPVTVMPPGLGQTGNKLLGWRWRKVGTCSVVQPTPATRVRETKYFREPYILVVAGWRFGPFRAVREAIHVG